MAVRAFMAIRLKGISGFTTVASRIDVTVGLWNVVMKRCVIKIAATVCGMYDKESCSGLQDMQ